MPNKWRAASSISALGAGDDLVLPFQIEGMDVRGRLVRLGSSVDQVLSAHSYPEPVSALLGEALVLAAMLGAALKFDGLFTVQAQGNGPVSLLVADFEAEEGGPGRLRGYAAFDRRRVADLQERAPQKITLPELLGDGSLALTIDPRLDRDRYQGIVPLEGLTLSECARVYFDRSEQIPTFVALAVARHYAQGGIAAWRAGGLLVQSVATAGGFGAPQTRKDEDDWTRAMLLARTIETDELVDPLLSPERLLLRLFHEDGVRVFDPFAVAFGCRCNRGKVEAVLATYPRETLSEMVESDGQIRARCEFCNTEYAFELDALTQS